MQIINKFLRLQKLYIFFISFLLFIIIFSTSFLHAKNFKVTDIKISSSFDLNFNKNKAIDEGFKDSFSNLLSMITTSGDKEKIKNIPLKELKGLIDSFTISEEKFINNEYFAKLDTTFNKKKTLSFLEKKNIFPSTPVRNSVLLIPILVDVETDKIYLFTDNIFYKKWNNEKKNYHLLNYLLPSEDLDDMNSLQQTSRSIENYDFINLINKYDLQDYIISIIFYDKNEVKVLSKINLNKSLKINNQSFFKMNINSEKDFEKIRESLKTTYENYWKKNNEINTSIKLPLTISINAQRYKKILELENALNSMDLVSNFYILKFDNQNVYFKIIYNGSPRVFLNDFNKRNIDLLTKNEIWSVKWKI